MKWNEVVVICILLLLATNAKCILIYVNENENVTLSCNRMLLNVWQGPPDYTTYISNDQIHRELPQAQRLAVVKNLKPFQFNLQIKHFKRDDEGQYKCIQFTGLSRKEKYYDVRLIVNPANITIVEEKTKGLIYGLEGHEMNLTCIVESGYPKETLVFLSNNTIITIGGPHVIVLTFVPKLEDHLRNFICRAYVNDTAFTLEHRVSLLLTLLPRINFSSGPIITAIEGEDVEINCDILTNNAIRQISWRYINNTLREAFPNNLTNQASLTLDNIGRNQSGEYTCIVENEAGIANNTLTVIVNYIPTVSIVYRKIGMRRTLYCLPDGNPQNYTFFKWEHLSVYHDHIRYLMGSGNGELFLNHTAKETDCQQDNGIYVCRVSNGIQTDGKMLGTGTYHFIEKGKPYFVSSNQNEQFGIYKMKAEIMVYFVSIPHFSNISVLENQSVNSVVLSNDYSTKVIHRVYGKDIYVNALCIPYRIFVNSINAFTKYTFVVQNRIGYNSFTVDLKSKTNLTVTIKASPLLSLFEGDSLTLTCEYDFPELISKIIWKYNNSLLFGGDFTADHNSIFFNSVNRHHTGYYGCEVVSGLGNAFTSTLVTVNAKKSTISTTSAKTTVLIVAVLLLVVVVFFGFIRKGIQKIQICQNTTASRSEPTNADGTIEEEVHYDEIDSVHYISVIDGESPQLTNTDFNQETFTHLGHNIRFGEQIDVLNDQLSVTSSERSHTMYLIPCNSYTELQNMDHRAHSMHEYPRIEQQDKTIDVNRSFSGNRLRRSTV